MKDNLGLVKVYLYLIRTSDDLIYGAHREGEIVKIAESDFIKFLQKCMKTYGPHANYINMFIDENGKIKREKIKRYDNLLPLTPKYYTGFVRLAEGWRDGDEPIHILYNPEYEGTWATRAEKMSKSKESENDIHT
jgi:hypothetical protein